MALYFICDICISYMVLNKEKRKNKKYFELLLWTMVDYGIFYYKD